MRQPLASRLVRRVRRLLSVRTPGRANLRAVANEGERTVLSGWILHPDYPTESIDLFVDGVQVAEQVPSTRPEILRTFPWIPHADRAAFEFTTDRPRRRTRAEVVARGRWRNLVTLRTTLSPEFDELPLPPPELRRRVTGWESGPFFTAEGVRASTEFLDAIGRVTSLDRVPRLLDWGCGCGRIAVPLSLLAPAIEVHGCDIDAEAVAWCRAHIAGGRFRVVPPAPPTDYADGMFSVVIGYSVLTHLSDEMQQAWLAEIRRVLAPGGLFFASVNGRFAARFAFADRADVLDAGFFDNGADSALDGIAPPSYYRGVFQTEEWTRRRWSKHFEVLALHAGGMQHHQDLVVLRRR